MQKKFYTWLHLHSLTRGGLRFDNNIVSYRLRWLRFLSYADKNTFLEPHLDNRSILWGTFCV